MNDIRDQVASPRFCEWLDATAALANGWPHSSSSAARWVCAECGVSSLADIETNPEASAIRADIGRRFADWDQNGELGV